MIILIEGNEGSGKTTLAYELSKRFPAVIMKYPKNFEDVISLFDLVNNANFHVIFDRSFISDIVYRIYDCDKTNQNDLADIAKMLRDTEISVIYCRNDKSFENSIQRGEDNITTKTDHEKINQIYEYTMQFLKSFTDINIISYDYEKDRVFDIMKGLVVIK